MAGVFRRIVDTWRYLVRRVLPFSEPSPPPVPIYIPMLFGGLCTVTSTGGLLVISVNEDPLLTSILSKLIGYWPMEHAGTDVTWLDVGPDALHLTRVATITGAAGKHGLAYYGGAGALEYTADTALTFEGGASFELCAWVQMDNTGQNKGIMSRYDVTTNRREYSLLVESGNAVFALSRDGTAANTVVVTGGSVGEDSFRMLNGWRDVDNDLIGVQVDNGTATTAAYSSADPVFTDTNNRFLVGVLEGSIYGNDGRIDEMAVFSPMLTADERAWLYNAGAGRTTSDFGL